jgi:Caspase domain
MARSVLFALLSIFCLASTAQAQSYSEVLEKCRQTVGYPLVHPCMMQKRNDPRDRETKLEECREQVHARPLVQKCVEAGMAKAEAAHRGPQQEKQVKEQQAAPQVATKPTQAPAVAPAAEAQPATQQATVSPPPGAPVTAPFGKRIALLIGNGGYEHVPTLPNAKNDATALAAALRNAGFQSVTLKTDLKRDEIMAVLSDFARAADSADWAVVYYSGHGIEYRGTNYLIPVDARLLVDRDIDLEAVDIGKVMSTVEGAKRLRLIILDACRNNPFLDSMKRTIATRAVTRGLAPVEPDAGSLIVYSAKHGETALDGDGNDSPFATALINRLQTPNLEIRRLFDLVRDDVLASTNKRQQPFTYGSLSGSEDFYFVTK